MAEGLQIGLKDIHIALLTQDDNAGVTYETPISVTKGMNAKITPKANTEKVFADDTLADVVVSLGEIDVEIEVSHLPIETQAILLGHNVKNGVLIENKDNIPPDLALGFKSKKSNGNYRYVWLLKGKFEPYSDEYATIEDKPKIQTPKVKGTFMPRLHDGNWRFVADEDHEEFEATTATEWFTKVYEPTTTP